MASGIELNIEADVKDAVAYLKDIEGNSKKVQRAILTGIGTSTKNVVKKQYRSYLHKDTGKLYKSIKKKMNKRGDTVFVGAWARGENHVFYGHALAQGSTIRAKNQDYLTFQVEGKWVKKHSVKLPSANFVQGPAERYIGSQEYQRQLDKIMAKQIEKIEKRRGWK